MNSTQQLRSPGGRFNEELERIQKVARHNDLAYAAALHLCVEERAVPPLWLMHEVDKLLIDLLKREKPSKRGRHAGRIARYRQDLRDYARWDAVEDVRRRRQEYHERAEEMAGYSAELRRKFGCIDKIMRWFRYGTFQCASLSLCGTDAFAGSHTIKASYRRVSRRMRSSTEALRYYAFWGDFLFRIGVPWPGSYHPGMKITPFYDLKP